MFDLVLRCHLSVSISRSEHRVGPRKGAKNSKRQVNEQYLYSGTNDSFGSQTGARLKVLWVLQRLAGANQQTDERMNECMNA